MIDKEQQTKKKLRGGYYTPKVISKYLWEWVSLITPSSLLDPAAGDGSLLEPISYNNINIDAVELFNTEANKIKKKQLKGNISIYNDDFFKWIKNCNNKYDAIVSNPPYIRYQYLTNYQRVEQSKILIDNGMKSNKLINAWVAFITASINVLKDGGRIALVLPTDFLQVTYAKQLRKFIINQMQKLNIITFKNNVFPGTQQDILILLGEKGNDNLSFKYSVADNTDKLPKFDDLKIVENINANGAKWSDLYLSNYDRNFLTKLNQYTIPFNEIAKVGVGITTGLNSFFSLTNNEVYNLHSKNFVKPLLGRSVGIKGTVFNKNVLSFDSKLGQKIWLLDLNGYNKSQLPSQLKDYIMNAENQGMTNTYKLRIRKNWYQIPSIWIPDAFLLRRIGPLPKLVLNKINAVSTDTFHRIKLIDNSINTSLLLFSFYSSISLISIELSGRTYGGGALEILPGDMHDVRLPSINYNSSIKLDKELDILNKLIEKNDTVQVAKYADSILQKKLNFKFDSKRACNILRIIQSFRIK